MKKISWTRRNKLFAGLGGVAAAALAVVLVFAFVWMPPDGGKLFGLTVNGYEIKPGADLRSADFRKADLHKANLSNASLYRADLSNANLTEANLTDAYLVYAVLRGAKLTKANLTNAYLYGVDLYEANLKGAVFNNTTMPDGSIRNH